MAGAAANGFVNVFAAAGARLRGQWLLCAVLAAAWNYCKRDSVFRVGVQMHLLLHHKLHIPAAANVLLLPMCRLPLYTQQLLWYAQLLFVTLLSDVLGTHVIR